MPVTGNPTAAIEDALVRASRCRERCSADAALACRLRAVRLWQGQRLAATYGDLYRDPGLRQAVVFFLDDLYGPDDFTGRDEAFARAWPQLRRFLPAAALEVLAQALELHALTLELDSSLAALLTAEPITATGYLRAYRMSDQAAARVRQIELIVGIGSALTSLVHRPWVGLALLAARAPAHAAGFGVLQGFLERGYEAFRAVSDPRVLLDAIDSRERRLMDALFASEDARALVLLQPGSRDNG